VLPGVLARVTNTGTNEVQTQPPTAPALPLGNLAVGNYTVSFVKSGFKTLERKGIVC